MKRREPIIVNLDKVAVGVQIGRARRMRRWRAKRLAEVLGVSRGTVSLWESGRTLPSRDHLLALCIALHVSVELIALGVPLRRRGNWWRFLQVGTAGGPVQPSRPDSFRG